MKTTGTHIHATPRTQRTQSKSFLTQPTSIELPPRGAGVITRYSYWRHAPSVPPVPNILCVRGPPRAMVFIGFRPAPLSNSGKPIRALTRTGNGAAHLNNKIYIENARPSFLPTSLMMCSPVSSGLVTKLEQVWGAEGRDRKKNRHPPPS
jgi:hypothetical protein